VPRTATLLGLLAMSATLAAPAPTDDPPKVEIIAHRGASFDAPENTLPAFDLAWEQKADAIECDVFLTKDRQVVVLHDADLKRVAGVNRKVADLTLAELRKLDVGKWKGQKFAGTRVPTLEEVLETVPAGKRVFIEIKDGPVIVPFFLGVIDKAVLKPEQMVVISFSYEIIEMIEQTRPVLKTYWVVDLRPKKGERPRTVEQLIARAQKIRTDGIDVSAGPELTPEFAKAVKDAKLELYVWTVNDAVVAKRMVELGVNGITTDRPAWLREQISK
jgi:glycerophosphoryl diester phosphodiesterase